MGLPRVHGEQQRLRFGRGQRLVTSELSEERAIDCRPSREHKDYKGELFWELGFGVRAARHGAFSWQHTSGRSYSHKASLLMAQQTPVRIWRCEPNVRMGRVPMHTQGAEL